MTHIIEKIKTQTTWGKLQLLQFLEPEVNAISINLGHQAWTNDTENLKISTKKLAVYSEVIEYIKTKPTHGSTELRLKILDIIAKEI